MCARAKVKPFLIIHKEFEMINLQRTSIGDLLCQGTKNWLINKRKRKERDLTPTKV